MMARACETWMPVTGTFRTYPFAVEILRWEMGPVLMAKGHHNPELFLAAAVEEWAAEDYDALTLYEDGGWKQLEGPVWPPAPLRMATHVSHRWCATRMHAQVIADGYSYAVEWVQPWERGAYPVTVVEA